MGIKNSKRFDSEESDLIYIINPNKDLSSNILGK